MFPRSTYEIIVEQEIIYFKDVWAYADFGRVGTVISMSEQIELEWDENFENVTTKNDDNLWVSFPLTYIKKNVDGVTIMEKLTSMNDMQTMKRLRNNEKIKLAKERLKSKMKNKVIKLGAHEYRTNTLYRTKVRSLLTYAVLSKKLMKSMFLNNKYANIKVGLYLACFSFSCLCEVSVGLCSDFVLAV